MAKRRAQAKKPTRTNKPTKPAPSKPAARAKHRPHGVTPGARRGMARISRPPHLAGALTDLRTVDTARKVFWSNVMREILCSLCMASMKLRGERSKAMKPNFLATEGDSEAAKIFDGRLAIITSWGARLSISGIDPVMGAGPARGATAMSMAVECSVFQIRTAEGDVWTLPLHEIRAFHALTEEIMQSLSKSAEEGQTGEEEDRRPFGFKAFASLGNPLEAPPPESTESQSDYLGE